MKASEAYFKGKFHTVSMKPLENSLMEVQVFTWDGKKGRCVIKRNQDGSLEVVDDEDLS